MTINVLRKEAHSEGFTTVAYKTDGTAIITGGQDAKLHVYNTLRSQRNTEPKILDEHTEPVCAIATHRANFATAGEDGTVLIFRNSTNDFEKFLVRSTTPIRSLSFNNNGTRIAVATDENVIRIILVRDISKIVTLSGHTTLVKSVAFSPTSDHLISTDIGGDIKIWDMNHSSGAPQCVKTLPGAVRKCASDADVMNTIAWSPDGAYFCFAGKEHEICVYSTKDWTQKYALEFAHFNDIITMAWSPNGSYIASVGKDRTVVIWDTTNQSDVVKYENTDAISGVAWHPQENELALTDLKGQLLMWYDPINISTMGHPAKKATQEVDDLEHLFEESSTQQASLSNNGGSTRQESLLDNVAQDHDIEEEEEGEELDDEGEDVDMASDMGDFVIDDDGAGYAEEQQRPQRQTTIRNGITGRAIGPQHKITEQATFQPGSTTFRTMDTTVQPPIPLEGERRYMAFNMFGIIYTIYQGAHSIVNVEFHDQAHNRNFHFTDYYHYTMASIGPDGAVFAVEGGKRRKKEEKSNDDEDSQEPAGVTPSVIHYRPLMNWANNLEWTIDLPEGENVKSIAINESAVVAVTSAGYVRMFTISGLQNHIFRLENIVATAAHGNLVLLVYKNGGTGLNGEQNLEFMLMDTTTQDIIQRGNLPLQKGSHLTWIGFSETSQALMYDSNYVLSILHRQRSFGQSYWIPVFDGKLTAKRLERQERYWPVGMLRDRLMCLIVRGTNEAPYFPRPPVDDIELHMPVINLDTEAGQLEEAHMRMRLISNHDRTEAVATNQQDEYHDVLREADAEMDKTLLRLIQIACRTDKEQRILDLAAALHSSRSVDAAVKVATHFKLSNVAEKLVQIKEEKFMMHDEMLSLSKRSMELDLDDESISSKRIRY